MRLRVTGLCFALAVMIGCAAPPVFTTIAACHPEKSVLRADLDRRWKTPAGDIGWPADDGFAAKPVPLILRPGMRVDRFGDDCGRFLSPAGVGFHARSLPYMCTGQSYHAYRVVKPFAVLAGAALPYFGELGGGGTYKSDATVALLVANHFIEPAPQPGPAPCD